MAPRVSIRPSVLGTKGLLLFGVLELAFLATNYSNLFFLLLAFSAVLGALGAFWAHRNLRKLELRSIEVGFAAVDSTRSIRMSLDAGSTTRFDLAVELLLDGPADRPRESHRQVGYTPCAVGGHGALEGSLPGQPRGIRALKYLRVTSRFPFGFFEARTELPIELELVTHPIPASLCNDGGAGGHAGAGDRGTASSGRGPSLAGLRSFRPGDAVADMHWKATARRGAPVIKERERECDPVVDVVLDRRCDEAALERALAQATTLVLGARHGSPVRLSSQGLELFVDSEQSTGTRNGGSSRGASRESGNATAQALRWLAAADGLAADGPAPPSRSSALQLPSTTGGAT